MARVWAWAKAICSAVLLAPTEITAQRRTRSGYVTAHSRARAPPSEPPSTAYQLPMPRASASRASAAVVSRRVTSGNREPQGLPSGAGVEGPVEP